MYEDVFLERLIIEVHKTYDEWWCDPGEVYHKHREMHSYALEAAKNFHVHMLLLHYDRERFIECENLSEERVRFLNEVQEIVDIARGV